MSYKQPSTGIPIAPRLTAAAPAPSPNVTGVAKAIPFVEAAALPRLTDATRDGFSFRFLDQLPAMHPPIAVLDGDGESDELRAAAAPRRMRIEPEEIWLAGRRRAFWRGAIAGLIVMLPVAGVGGAGLASLLYVLGGGR